MDLCLCLQLNFVNQYVYFVPIPYWFYYYSSVVQLKFGECDTSNSSSIVQGCFNYPGILVFPYEAESILSSSGKNCVRIFMRSALDLEITFRRMANFYDGSPTNP